MITENHIQTQRYTKETVEQFLIVSETAACCPNTLSVSGNSD